MVLDPTSHKHYQYYVVVSLVDPTSTQRNVSTMLSCRWWHSKASQLIRSDDGTYERVEIQLAVAVDAHAPGENIFRLCRHSFQSVSNLLRCELPCGISNGVKRLGDSLHRPFSAVAAPARATVTTGRAGRASPTVSGLRRGLCDAGRRLQGLQRCVHPAKQSGRWEKRHLVRCVCFKRQQ